MLTLLASKHIFTILFDGPDGTNFPAFRDSVALEETLHIVKLHIKDKLDDWHLRAIVISSPTFLR